MGRFTTVDPSGWGLNLYAYCRNNPLIFTDPTGLREHIDGEVYDNTLFTVVEDENSECGYHIVDGGKYFPNIVAKALANSIISGDMKWVDSIDGILSKCIDSRGLVLTMAHVGDSIDIAFDPSYSGERGISVRIDAFAFIIGFGMNIAGEKNGPSIWAKLRLAKSIGNIPRSASPNSQGRYGSTLWWEYTDSQGKLKIVVQHPDGTVHVGTPKPQSQHHQGGPPKYYPIPGSGHVGE